MHHQLRRPQFIVCPEHRYIRTCRGKPCMHRRCCQREIALHFRQDPEGFLFRIMAYNDPGCILQRLPVFVPRVTEEYSCISRTCRCTAAAECLQIRMIPLEVCRIPDYGVYHVLLRIHHIQHQPLLQQFIHVPSFADKDNLLILLKKREPVPVHPCADFIGIEQCQIVRQLIRFIHAQTVYPAVQSAQCGCCTAVLEIMFAHAEYRSFRARCFMLDQFFRRHCCGDPRCRAGFPAEEDQTVQPAGQRFRFLGPVHEDVQRFAAVVSQEPQGIYPVPHQQDTGADD